MNPREQPKSQESFGESAYYPPGLSAILYLLAAMSGAVWSLLSFDGPLKYAVFVPVAVGLLCGRYMEKIGLRRRLSDQSEQAYKDHLTGLPTRRLFLQQLQACLERPLKSGQYTALFFIDLDRFKGINDALGHLAGDRFLLEISSRLNSCLGPQALLARFGGDEFTIVLNPVGNRQEVIQLADRVMEQFEREIEINGHKLWANTSMGIAMVGMPRPSADDFLAMADAALYNAKAQGRGQYVLFEPNLPRPTPRTLSLDADIRTALDRNQLVLKYQPVYRLSDFHIAGMEALIRWDHPLYGLLSPGDFIPLAEQTGVIKALGAWVAETACERISGWQSLYGDGLTMSINLSALQFRQKDILAEIVQASSRSGLSPGSLQLEITETVLLQDDQQTINNLRDLRRIGFRIAIDDFGVGYSSLSYLGKFEIDTLKLDQSFLKDPSHHRTRSLALGIVQLGHSLGMRIVAEGIETEEQLRFIRNTYCDEGQGYLLGEPLEERQVIELLTNGRQATSPLLRELLAEERVSSHSHLIPLTDPLTEKRLAS